MPGVTRNDLIMLQKTFQDLQVQEMQQMKMQRDREMALKAVEMARMSSMMGMTPAMMNAVSHFRRIYIYIHTHIYGFLNLEIA
jgi:hypothetical protein